MENAKNAYQRTRINSLPWCRMKISNDKRLEVIDAIARGFPLTKALGMTGCYSKSSVSHASVAIVSTKPYRNTMRQYAETLAEMVGEQPIANELELVRIGKAPFREIRTALQAIWKVYNAKVGGDAPASYEVQEFSKAEYRSVKQLVKQKFWTPEAQAKIQEMRERAKAIQPGDLSALATVIHAQDLLDPPSDHRARNTSIRTAYERDGMIGAPRELNVFQNNSINVHAMPAVARQMMAQQMVELALEKGDGKSFEEIVTEVEKATGIVIKPAPQLPAITATPVLAPEVTADNPGLREGGGPFNG